jgi:hypothetical protein
VVVHDLRSGIEISGEIPQKARRFAIGSKHKEWKGGLKGHNGREMWEGILIVVFRRRFEKDV